MWDTMKMAKAIKAVRSEEMGLKKQRRHLNYRHSQINVTAKKHVEKLINRRLFGNQCCPTVLKKNLPVTI
jgi:hypothetical protein